jgi:hypothetical protein
VKKSRAQSTKKKKRKDKKKKNKVISFVVGQSPANISEKGSDKTKVSGGKEGKTERKKKRKKRKNIKDEWNFDIKPKKKKKGILGKKPKKKQNQVMDYLLPRSRKPDKFGFH